MRPIVAWLALLAAPAFALADEPTLKEARTRWLHGNHAEAKTAFERLAKGEKPPAAVFIGLSRTLQSTGEYDQALEVIESALKKTPNVPELLARQAELLYFRGRWEDAEKAADAAIKKQDDQFLARWMKGQILR